MSFYSISVNRLAYLKSSLVGSDAIKQTVMNIPSLFKLTQHREEVV